MQKKIANNWKAEFHSALVSWLLTGQAVAQASSPDCSGASSPAIRSLVVLINDLQGLALSLAPPAAGLAYSYCGLLWLSGSPELQRRARRIFANATIGLIIVILSEGIVAIISEPLCGGT